MTVRDPRDTSAALALTPLTPDAIRSARTRQMCGQQFARRERRRVRSAAVKAHALQAIAPLIVGLYCALYAAALVATTWRFEWVWR